ncbi:type I restriction-modification system subunit M N-terminal domain-containing protein [Psychrobacter sp. 1U2]|uniref:type I restriction-modification system subunit M N-terminal domain-containing protein n=1 Tax=Psychrobacter sp. 1U2 TaxID=3453577 RepID=UPI003F48BED6
MDPCSTTKNFSQTAAFIWFVADLLRGDFKQSQYGRIILPFTLLRRLECVLEETKAEVRSQTIVLIVWAVDKRNDDKVYDSVISRLREISIEECTEIPVQ